jgi:hypothetical protein
MAKCSWVGIDLHRSRSRVAVLDDHGSELISRGSQTIHRPSSSCWADRRIIIRLRQAVVLQRFLRGAPKAAHAARGSVD